MEFRFDFDGSEGTDKKFIQVLEDFLRINKELTLSSLFSKDFTDWILNCLENKQSLDIMRGIIVEKENTKIALTQAEVSKQAASKYAKALESFKSVVKSYESTSKSVEERHKKILLVAHESVASSSAEVEGLRREVILLKAQLYTCMYPVVIRKR